ncbi:uncharacterized protein LOC134242119 [Saccostrea cucullata]|uniref:uncharacterized protein LOC134242119 n=1 Tax=Saccostrea cuccullata TaxID=36930 RepID=UPI002ECFCCE3
MPKRKKIVGRECREKDKLRKRQKRQQKYQSSMNVITDEHMADSFVPCGTLDGAVSAPPGNLPGQGSMGLPPIEEKPLARVQASPRVKMHSNAPRLSSPQGSRLFVHHGDKALSPDSPVWVCTPARVPGHDDGFKPSPAGQTQLDTSRMEETSSTLKKDEGYKDSIKEMKNERVLNGIFTVNKENFKSEKQDVMYERQKNEIVMEKCEKQVELENTHDTQRIIIETDKNMIRQNIFEMLESELFEKQCTYVNGVNKNLDDLCDWQKDECVDDFKIPKMENENVSCEEITLFDMNNDNEEQKASGETKLGCPIYVQGSFHQGDPMFGANAGSQCVANCLAGLAYHKAKCAEYWKTMDMNKILVTGDELYSYLQRSSSITNRYLLVEELPELFECFDRSYEFTTMRSLTSVILSEEGFDYSDFGAYCLEEALQLALTGTDGCFVCFGGNTLVIGKTEDGFFTFDSHSRSSEGLLSVNGKSTRVLFENLDRVCAYLQALARSMGYIRNVECNVTGAYCKMKCVSETRSQFDQKREDISSEKLSFDESPRNAFPSHITSFDAGIENDDLVFISIEDEQFNFVPLISDTKKVICRKLKIPFLCYGVPPENQPFEKQLGKPCDEHKISGDGNCFFRAVSFSLTNSEDYHYDLRSAVCKHMLENEDYFLSFLRRGERSVKDHVLMSSMEKNGTWATEIEIKAMSHLLGVDIYTFSNNRWLKFSAEGVGVSVTEKRLGAIYLCHNHQTHYNVALDVCGRELEKINTVVLQSSQYNLRYVKRRQNRERMQIKRINPSKMIKKDSAESTRRQSLRRKYREDLEFRNKKLTIACKKYKEDTEFQTLVRTRNRERYQNDTIYKSKTKSRCKNMYEGNVENKEKKKMASVKKYATNQVHKENVKMRSIQKYKTDNIHRENMKKKSIMKYKTDDKHKDDVKRRFVKKYSTDSTYRDEVKRKSKKKYKSDIEHREQVKKRSSEKYRNDEQHKINVKQRALERYRSNEEYRNKVNSAGTKRYRANKNFRERVLASRAKRYSVDVAFRSNAKACSKKSYNSSSDAKKLKKKTVKLHRAARLANLQKEEEVLALFKENTFKGIDFTCCCCNRLLFVNQVHKCDRQIYHKSECAAHVADLCIQENCLHQCTQSCPEDCSKSTLWICYTCHRKILSGNIPAEATVNNMFLEDIPGELRDLNSLEQHLIALHIPFMKVMALPQGGQRNIHGPVVCVPSDLKKATSLPLKHGDDLLLRVKLKRKLNYRGYFEYQFVNPNHVFTALNYLKKNNQWYKTVKIDTNWRKDDTDDDFKDEDQDQEKAADDENDEIQYVATDTCLQPVDIAQEVLDHYFDDIYNIAPGEGRNPVRMLQEPGNEAKTFPCHFPSGKFSWNEERATRITLARYFNNRLMNADDRFAKDSNYIFFSQFMSELNQVIEKTQISIRKSVSKMGTGKLVTSDMVQDPDILRTLLQNDEALRFMQPIRGTPAYWSSAQKDLFAMLRQLGIPTWFCSFSAAEHRWNDAIRTILKQQNDNRNPNTMDWSEKNETLRSNPVTVARMFEHRFHVFHRDVVCSPSNPIGKVVDFFQRVEFQQRGSPHMHCLYWVENAPRLEENGEKAVCDFIDKHVTCEVPSENDDPVLRSIVLAVQQHSKKHSKSCRKKGTECRFNYPRPPSQSTFISSPCDEDEAEIPQQATLSNISKSRAKDILMAVWNEVQSESNELKSTEEIFSKISLTQEMYEEAHNMLTKKKSIILKRNPSDLWINQYNPCLLKCWDANMDIQFVLDPFSCIVYIISYISKSEREMGMLIKQTKVEAEEGNLDAHQTLKRIGSAYLHHREVSVQEAVYRVCNLKMKECSRKVVFVPIGENPTRLSKPLSQLKRQKRESYENNEDVDEDDNEIWMTNIIERYENRPDMPLFHNTCLAEFCSEFRVLAKSQLPKNENKNVFELQNSKGYIQKRTRTMPAVIRYPRFNAEKTSEKYYQSLLQLFLPHWNETQMKPPGFDLYETFYGTGHIRIKGKQSVQSVKSVVDTNHARYAANEEVLNEAMETFENIGEPEDAWANLCPETEVMRDECVVDKNKADGLLENVAAEIPDMQNETNSDVLYHIQQNNHSREEILPVLQNLNERQKDIFYHVRNWCLGKIAGEKLDPLHIFITGGAGTGKSHVVKAIHYEASRLFAPSLFSPDGVSVLLTAFTGTAAFNIGGNTLHHVFALTKYLPLPYQPLKEQSLSELRVQLRDLQILVIDEVSMVYKKLLFYIHERLVQIKKCKQPFGGVSVIAVGDFYQLPPVKQRKDERLYKENTSYPVDFWRDFFKIIELSEIMRQRQDVPFATALNNLRIREPDQPLTNETQVVIADCVREGPEDVLHVFSTNEEVNTYNLTMLRKTCEDLVEIEVQDFHKNATTGKLTMREKPLKGSKTDSLGSTLLLAVNARVMLTRNCDVKDGLVNGVVGYVAHFQYDENTSNVKGIGVIFDNKNVGKQSGRKTQRGNVVLVQRVQEEMIEKKSRTVMRHQFPLRLAWACTAHKVQGMTVEKVVVNLDRTFSPGQAYVALSRVTSQQGLFIETVNESGLLKKMYADSGVKTGLSEMPVLRLQTYPLNSSECNTVVLHNIQSLHCHFPDFERDIRFRDAEIICLTETWLRSEQITACFDIEDYSFHHKAREDLYDNTNDQTQKHRLARGGGVALYIKNSKVEKIVSSLPVKNVEGIAVRLVEDAVLIITIYRPNTLSVPQFIDRLQNIIEYYRKNNEHLIFHGDFNEDAKSGGPIQTFMSSLGFRQVVNFCTTEKGTILDHVYVSGPIQIEVCRLPTYYSYHDAVVLKLLTRK